MNKGHDAAIRKALEYMKANLANQISMNEVARQAGLSNSYLRSIFIKSTGKGPLPHLIQMRIQKAKDLLQDTALSISEISFATGFNGLGQFSMAFRKKVGCSPSDYRKSVGAAQKPQVKSGNNARTATTWHHESFKGTVLSPSFQAVSGEWQQMDSFLSGRAEEDALIRFGKPLPESCRISFEARLTPWPNPNAAPSAEVDLFISDAAGSSNYGVFVLGRFGGAIGEFRPHGFGSQQNPSAVLKRDQWHRIELELNDNTMRLSANGEELFAFRDPFPPPYSLRSHLGVGTYQGKVDIREFKVYDIGSYPLVRSIRQGDSLYNAGLFSPARDFYLRLLNTENTTEDLMELRYKIALCFLREREHLQARNWLDKVIDLPETRFWADLAKLSRLEADIQENSLENLEQRVASLARNKVLRHGLREIFDEVGQSSAGRGFYEKARYYKELLLSIEEPGSFPYISAQAGLADALIALRRFAEAESAFRAVIDDPITPASFRTMAVFSLCDCLGFQGKRGEWELALAQIESAVTDITTIARHLVSHSIFLQAGGDLPSALSELSRIHSRLPWAHYWRSLAEAYSAWAYCCLGDTEKARRSLDEAVRLDPSNPRLRVGWKSMWYYPVELASGDYEKAAEFLKDDFAANQTNSLGAEQGVKAGIMYCLAGKNDEAVRIWKRTSELFIERQICFFGRFAKELSEGDLRGADEMPYPAEKRSEMFYLLGLLCESRNDKQRAWDFFRKSVEEDLVIYWPAYLARKKTETI